MNTLINEFQDILNALEREPALRSAMRSHILSEELIRLPADFKAFTEEQRAFNEEQRVFREEQKAVNAAQTRWNQNADARFNRMEGDMSGLKGDYARTLAARDASGIASDMGLQYVRTLSMEDLTRMADNNLPRDVHRSFRNADLVIEATDGEDTRYITVEISFTADRRELDRAVRNAGLITQFTGKTAHAAVASVRNDLATTEAIESGTVYWHPLEDRTPVPE